MKLITWNTARRVRALSDQLDFLASRAPDVVALQEVTAATVAAWADGAPRLGLRNVRHTLGIAGEGPRALGVLIASRYPLSVATNPIRSPWVEKSLSVRLAAADQPVELHTVHVPPGSSNGWVKVEVLEAVYTALARVSATPSILCGDFNTPQEERTDGEIVTWGQTISGSGLVRLRQRIGGASGDRWDAAERNVLAGLSAFGIEDVYRSLHGYESDAWSWMLTRNGREFRRRFDHVFASRDLGPERSEYLHEARGTGLSDHAPLEVELRLG